MTSIGTHLGPFRCGRITVGPFNQVTELLDIGGHLFHGNTALLSTDALGVIGRVLTGNTSRQDGQGFGTDILTELEILIEAQSAGLVVMPDIEVGLTCLQGSYGMVPVVDILKTLSVAHASARETHELRLQSGDGLCQILAQSVLTTLEGLLREQGYHVNTHTGCLQRYDSQTGLVIGCLRSQHC